MQGLHNFESFCDTILLIIGFCLHKYSLRLHGMFQWNALMLLFSLQIPKEPTAKNPNYPTANNKKYKVFNEEPNMYVVTAYFVEPCKSNLFILWRCEQNSTISYCKWIFLVSLLSIPANAIEGNLSFLAAFSIPFRPHSFWPLKSISKWGDEIFQWQNVQLLPI